MGWRRVTQVQGGICLDLGKVSLGGGVEGGHVEACFFGLNLNRKIQSLCSHSTKESNSI